jgi:RNA polymerase-binding transcription factor DksA
MTSVDERETVLRSRLEELEARLHGIEEELDSHTERDWEEIAVEREVDEVLEGMGQAGLAEMEAIRAALARVADDSYGFCVRCGAPISEERLDVLPATPFCRTCAQ